LIYAMCDRIGIVNHGQILGQIRAGHTLDLHTDLDTRTANKNKIKLIKIETFLVII